MIYKLQQKDNCLYEYMKAEAMAMYILATVMTCVCVEGGGSCQYI